MIVRSGVDEPEWLYTEIDPVEIQAVDARGAVLNHRDYPAAPPPCAVVTP